MHLRTLLLLVAALGPVAAVEYTWEWKPAPGEGLVAAEVCTFRYGKRWAYALEIDDGPKWVRDFAVPFLAQHTWTDAPPGVAGGRARPFVGGVAVILAAMGSSDQALSWADLDAIEQAGWGVINHSVAHDGRSWGDEAGRLDDRRVQEDAFWSQALLAANLSSARAPSACAYANGYTDYNRGDALAKVGIRIATRVGGSSATDVTRADVRWMDFPRTYLDENVWSSPSGGKGEAMADIPGAGPAANTLFIDFTHGIERDAASANHQRWKTRLSTIAARWGAGGDDSLWCAPTGEIADYVHAAKAATVVAKRGRLSVILPDGAPGSALTIRLTGLAAGSTLKAPEGGVLHRTGAEAWLTTPLIGRSGAPAPTPRLKAIYRGPAGSIAFPRSERVAGVTVHLIGDAPKGFGYRLALRTAGGDKVIAEPTFPGGWVVAHRLHPLLPTEEAVAATGFVLPEHPLIKGVVVWVLE